MVASWTNLQQLVASGESQCKICNRAHIHDASFVVLVISSCGTEPLGPKCYYTFYAPILYCIQIYYQAKWELYGWIYIDRFKVFSFLIGLFMVFYGEKTPQIHIKRMAWHGILTAFLTCFSNYLYSSLNNNAKAPFLKILSCAIPLLCLLEIYEQSEQVLLLLLSIGLKRVMVTPRRQFIYLYNIHASEIKE